MGYKKALQILLTNEKLKFEEATNLKVINNELNKNIDKKKFFWDQDFTNTFIYFNKYILDRCMYTQNLFCKFCFNLFEVRIY